jgi:hypothetical protein
LKLVAFAAVLGILTTGAAGAVPVAELHWETCDAPVYTARGFTATPVVLQVTIRGVDEPIRGIHLIGQFFFQGADGCPALVPDAWRFGTDGCQAGRMSAEIPGRQGCALLDARNTVVTARFENEAMPNLFVDASFDPWTPSGDSTYAMFAVIFDHSSSTIGPSHDGLCGGAELAACIQLAGVDLTRLDGSLISREQSAAALGWQSMACGVFCDPARPTTWGSVKAGYR